MFGVVLINKSKFSKIRIGTSLVIFSVLIGFLLVDQAFIQFAMSITYGQTTIPSTGLTPKIIMPKPMVPLKTLNATASTAPSTAVNPNVVYAPNIRSDKTIYAFSDVVSLTGWIPNINTNVNIKVLDARGFTDVIGHVTTDNTGHFSFNFNANNIIGDGICTVQADYSGSTVSTTFDRVLYITANGYTRGSAQVAANISTDKNTYQKGDTIKITGRVAAPNAGEFVDIVVKDPGGTPVNLVNPSVSPDDYGYFSYTFIEDKLGLDGIYTFMGTYSGQSTGISKFELKDGTKSTLQAQSLQSSTSIAQSSPQASTPSPQASTPSPQASTPSPQASIPSAQTSIPSWIKHNAKWWSDGSVADGDFVKGIQWMIQNGAIKIPQTQSSSSGSQQIPSWIKKNAGWWADGQISDDEFMKGIQYLVQKGIISVINNVNSDVGTLNVDQKTIEEDYSQSMYIKISGKINGYSAGEKIMLTMEKPDGSKESFSAASTSTGNFVTTYGLEASSQVGKYTITGNYLGKDFATVSFDVITRS